MLTLVSAAEVRVGVEGPGPWVLLVFAPPTWIDVNPGLS